jgi:hypothetical protein
LAVATDSLDAAASPSAFFDSAHQPKHFEYHTALTVLTVQRMMTSVSPNRPLPFLGGVLLAAADKSVLASCPVGCNRAVVVDTVA